MRRWILVTTLLLTACGPSPQSGDDDDDSTDEPSPDAYEGELAQVTGVVWMPGQGPGSAAPGEEVPVFGALVYLTRDLPDPIPQEVYCERCVDAPGNAVSSAHDGSFTLSAVPGDYYLVIQKGQWRLEQPVTLGPGSTLALTDAETTLPTVHDPANGAWIPRIAIVLGTNDNVEDILGKVGLGNFDASTHDFLDGGTEVTVIGSAQEALSNLDLLRQFHIVFFPCNTAIDDDAVPGLDDQSQLANLRRYVNEGGKLYVTDWSGEMMDRPFPPQIELGGDAFGTYYDSKGTYDPQTFTGTLTQLGSANNSSYTSNDAEVVDPDLHAWLGLQYGPSPVNPTPMMFDPDNFTVTGNYNWINALTSVQTGTDEDGLPIVDDPKAWVIGSRGPSAPAGKHPLSVTFEPTGCGRVMYSTYQTANGHHPGLYPQERVLLYLIMEIAVCSDVPVVE